MKPKELVWRVQQKKLQKWEQKEVFSLHKPVIEIPLPQDINSLHIEIEKISINWDNEDWTEFTSLDLFGIYDYAKYRNSWNAGFQTDNFWPNDLFSPTININQRVDIGDIRTNWELNRLFQFAALAKSFYVTRNDKYFVEFKELFYSWNEQNLFLHGVEWTSAMELAIRINSWVYAFAFLKKAGCEEKLLNDIEHGILVMTDYVLKHRARFSSANNHLIVEMYAVALVGIITGYSTWYDEALKILTEELPRQNFSDGVNKEMSLHYQGFVMEAYGLLWLLMVKNKFTVPYIWKTYLRAMTEFVADSTGDFGNTMEFGDDDEGKILDLKGTIENYYQYILNLMGCLLDQKYTDASWHENLKWIVPEELWNEKGKYIPDLVCSRKEGGYTFLRSKDRRILIGIDHAELGYGTIAAHGHADALSFQLFVGDQPIFVDSGTYNYHFLPDNRDYFRSTVSHNTVMINGKEQSEMIGPFLWGKKATTRILNIENQDDAIQLVVQSTNSDATHERIITFNFENQIDIMDKISDMNGEFILHLSPNLQYNIMNSVIYIKKDNISIRIENDGTKIYERNGLYSSRYNSKVENTQISLHFVKQIRVKMQIKQDK